MIQEMDQKRKPRIVAVVGSIASGKDALIEYLVERYRVMAVEIGSFARQLAREADEDEPHLQYDVSAKNLADHEPEHIMQRLVVELTEKEERPSDALVITGVRTPAEAATLKDHFGPDLLLTWVRVGNKKVRYERVKARDFPTDPDDFEEFVEQDEQMKAENAMEETAFMADVTLWNDGSLETFHQQIENYVVPHLFPEE